MKDKDRLLLLFNVYIGDINAEDAGGYMREVVRSMGDYFDDSVKCIFAPTRDKERPTIQAITDFPVKGIDLIRKLGEYIEENNDFEIKECAKAICELVKEKDE